MKKGTTVKVECHGCEHTSWRPFFASSTLRATCSTLRRLVQGLQQRLTACRISEVPSEPTLRRSMVGANIMNRLSWNVPQGGMPSYPYGSRHFCNLRIQFSVGQVAFQFGQLCWSTLRIFPIFPEKHLLPALYVLSSDASPLFSSSINLHSASSVATVSEGIDSILAWFATKNVVFPGMKE